MNRRPPFCRPHESLADAARTMRVRSAPWLVVVGEGRRVVGTISEHDICLAAETRASQLSAIAVEGAMHTDVHMCHPEDSASDVLVAMKTYRSLYLPVVDRQGTLVGVVSLGSLARRAAAGDPRLGPSEVVRAVAAIDEPRSAVEKV